MDAFSSSFDSQSRSNWRNDTLKNFRQISPIVQNQLKRAFLTLCCALIASGVEAYIHIPGNVGGYLTTFACIGTIIWFLVVLVNGFLKMNFVRNIPKMKK